MGKTIKGKGKKAVSWCLLGEGIKGESILVSAGCSSAPGRRARTVLDVLQLSGALAIWDLTSHFGLILLIRGHKALKEN